MQDEQRKMEIMAEKNRVAWISIFFNQGYYMAADFFRCF
jgi:hypothetical protein